MAGGVSGNAKSNADKYNKETQALIKDVRTWLANESKTGSNFAEAAKLIEKIKSTTTKNALEITKALKQLNNAGKLEHMDSQIFLRAAKDFEKGAIGIEAYVERLGKAVTRVQEYFREQAEAEKKAAEQERKNAEQVEKTADRTKAAAQKREAAAKRNAKASQEEADATQSSAKKRTQAADETIRADEKETAATKRTAKAKQEAATEIEKANEKQAKSAKKAASDSIVTQQTLERTLKSISKAMNPTYKSGDVDKIVKRVQTGFVKINRAIDETTRKVVDLTEKLKNLSVGGAIQVRVNNSGFDKIVKTFSDAITAAEKRMARAGRKGNPLEEVLGTKIDRRGKLPNGPSEAFKKLLKTEFGQTSDIISKEIDAAFTQKITHSLTKSLKKAIQGTMAGWSEDVLDSSQLAELKTVASMLRGTGLSDAVKLGIISTVYRRPGDVKADEDYKEFLKVEYRQKARKNEAEANAKAKVEMEKFNRLVTNDPNLSTNLKKEYQRQAEARTKQAEAEARASEKLEQEGEANAKAASANAERQELLLEKARAESSKIQYIREQFFSKVGEAAGRVNARSGNELTDLDKAEIKLANIRERFEEIAQKAMDGKINISQVDKVMTDLYNSTVKVAQEYIKLNGMNDFSKQIERNKKRINRYNSIDQISQAAANLNSQLNNIFSNIAQTFRSMFSSIRNQVIQLFYRVRSIITSTITSATEQYSKLEQAQIGYENFFGAGDAARLVSRVREEAIKAPSLSAGDLADYVSALAPVSKGDPNLALNAAMGVLKTIQYSGGDAQTEMSRVVTNIRDVISKGQANAVDIRQFQRAMPAIEQALSKLGASEFLKDGQLNVTKENARTILKAFAELNTNPDSPVANIFDRISGTWSGMLEAFSERKSQAGTTILEKSGAFDLAKRLLSDASKDSLFTYVETIGTRLVKKLVEFFDKVLTVENFKNTFEKFQKGFAMLKETISEVWKSISQLLPEDIKQDWITSAFKVISNAIRAFADGWKKTIEAVKWIADRIDPRIVETAASAIGLFMSPFTKMVQLIGKLATSTLGAVQNTAKLLGKVNNAWNAIYSKWGENFSQELALQWTAENRQFSQANIDAMAKQVMARFESAKRKNGGTGVAENVTITADNMLYRNGKLDTNASSKIQSAGGWASLSSAEQADLAGVSKMSLSLQNIQNRFMQVANTFVSQLGKITAGGSMLLLGEGIRSLAKSTSDGAYIIGNAMRVFGSGMTGYGLGKGIGSIFGPLGGQIGSIVGMMAGIGLTIVDAINQSQVMKEEAAKESAVRLDEQFREDLANAVAQLAGLDTSSNAGYYANEELRKYIRDAERGLLLGQGEEGSGFNGMEETINTLAAVAQSALNLYNQSDFMAAADDTDANGKLGEISQQVHDLAAVGEIYSDFGQDASERAKEIRDSLVEMIRTLNLLPQSSLEQTDENVLKAFLTDFVNENGVAQISEGQYKFLMDRYRAAQTMYATDIKKIADEFNSNGTFKNMETDISKIRGIIEEAYGKGKDRAEEGGVAPSNQSDEELGRSIANNHQTPFDYFRDQGIFNNSAIEGITKHFGDGLFSANRTEFDFLDETANNMLNHIGDNALIHLFRSLKLNAEFAQKVNDTEMLREIGEFTRMLIDPKWTEMSEDEAFAEFERVLREAANKDLTKYINEDYARAVFKQQVEAMKGVALNTVDTVFGVLKGETDKLIEKDNTSSQKTTIPKKARTSRGLLWKARATGGMVGSGVDTVPTLLQPGEFVMRRASVNQAGLGVLAALNRGDLAAAARSLGTKLGGNSWNNSRNWNNVTNNNQRSARNYIKIVNRNLSARQSTYYNLANRISMA